MIKSFLKRIFPFPKITRNWFKENTVTDPETSFKEYQKWLKEHKTPISEETRFRKILELGTGKKPATLTNYLHKNPERFYKIGEKTRRTLDFISISLGYVPPDWPRRPIPPSGQIALLVEMENIPSRFYHLEVIKGVIQAAARYKYSVTVHEISEKSLLKIVRQIILAFRPDGMIMIRIAPDKRSFEYLRHEEIPTILINADDRSYYPPVIRNLIPVYRKNLEDCFRLWIKKVKKRSLANNPSLMPKIVIAHMKVKDSHRRKRLTFITRIISEEHIRILNVQVPDYSFHRALNIWQQHPDADAYVCFSDQLAVALKQLMITQGVDWQHKLVGFDNSPLAIAENISSFGQELGEIKNRSFFTLKQVIESRTMAFERTEMQVSFFPRN